MRAYSRSACKRRATLAHVKHIVACLAVVVAAGCGGGGSASPDSTARPSTKGEPSPSATPQAPNVGQTALRLGETRHGLGVDTTVFEVVQPAKAPASVKPSVKSDEWITMRVKQCAHSDYKGPAFHVVWAAFAGLDRARQGYKPVRFSSDRWPPKPQFPEGLQLPAGRCAAGWILFEVAKGQRFSGVAVVSNDRNGKTSIAAEWRL